MENSLKPLARKNDIVVQELKGETLIYDLKSSKAYCLNETSALVWQLCDGTRTIFEVSDALSVRLKTLISEEFVWLALDQLDKDGLLEGEIENRFAGLSRREVIRKVGFASVVGLPIVSSVVAPPASMAQSGGVGLEQLCTSGVGSPSVCASGTNCITARTTAIPVIQTPAGNRCCVSAGGSLSGSEDCSSSCAGLASSCCTGNISRIADNPFCLSIGTGLETCRCI